MTQFIKICPNKAKNLSKRSDEFDYTYCCLHQIHHASLSVLLYIASIYQRSYKSSLNRIDSLNNHHAPVNANTTSQH